MNPLQLAFLFAADTDFFQARPMAKVLFQGSKAINDPSVDTFMVEQVIPNIRDALKNTAYLNMFVNSFSRWINTHHSSNVKNLDLLSADFSAGTTQSFDSFYLRHRTKRFRCLVGEYLYHIKSWESNKIQWKFINDDLATGDAVVISAPFCDTGSMHPAFNAILAECSKLNIPVLVDCCYYPISRNVLFDAAQPCIDTVAFSLSKAFPIANLRIGVRYTKTDIMDGQKLHHNINYNNHLSAFVGLRIIENYRSDYIAQSYEHKQKDICETLGLISSDSAIFAIGDFNWDMFNRSALLKAYSVNLDPGLFNNRICLNSIYEKWNLYTHLKNENYFKI